MANYATNHISLLPNPEYPETQKGMTYDELLTLVKSLASEHPAYVIPEIEKCRPFELKYAKEAGREPNNHLTFSSPYSGYTGVADHLSDVTNYIVHQEWTESMNNTYVELTYTNRVYNELQYRSGWDFEDDEDDA